MTTVKITKRERFESVKALVDAAVAAGVEGFDFDGIVEFCDKEMDTLTNRAAKAKERAAAKREAGDELQTAVLNVLTDEPATRDEIAGRIDPSFEASVAKVGYRLTTLVKNGAAVKEELTVVGEDGKNRKAAGYKLA